MEYFLNYLKVAVVVLLTVAWLPIDGGSGVVRPETSLFDAVQASDVYHPLPVGLSQPAMSDAPDFSTFADIAVKKEVFYLYLLPLVHEANQEVARERQWLKQLADQLVRGTALSETQLADLARMESRYRVRQPEAVVPARVRELLTRVDVVPASLVIAQAAKESGWGTSRFATRANNFFGIWCFYEGCGLVPLSRQMGRTHEVATFASVAEGVRYYVRTLNTHLAYEGLREMRAEARRASESVTGAQLALGLSRYSERGEAYIREIRDLIRFNQLHRFSRSYRA